METRRDVFQAIADPTRREIIDLLAQQSMNLNAIAEHFDITRPAVSNHIRILNECGIIHIEQVGRERFCKIQPDRLKQVSDWIGKYEDLWVEKIESFEKYLYQLKSKRKKHGRK
ncbi:winged helix-turn-helix domain-containing protein [Fulvivirgaceae bacterium PWU4]|uniref:Winged helix-turn-helix domain-containing protein n=1 Tax=Chryseosolibacter histidini TaxID=2782349 RepID=A0AAP2DQ56_9BACT|nr:metalloregulator ArsR/SmtB family transcription factor [Chryseosolibacter histidini]MBT1700458.1 winged helix-turn-helix domain-containing protein [Chryseosolibacter histidini]